VRVALDLSAVLAAGELTKELHLRAGVHRGPMMAATVNEQLDYFGTTVRQALALPELAGAGEVLLTQAVASDPLVAALLGGRGELRMADLAALLGGRGELRMADLPEGAGSVVVSYQHCQFSQGFGHAGIG
jgi:class 3 adenylate cyclase